MIDAPHIKALFYGSDKINSILRKLSDDGIVETLNIYTGTFDAEGKWEVEVQFQ